MTLFIGKMVVLPFDELDDDFLREKLVRFQHRWFMNEVVKPLLHELMRRRDADSEK